MLEIIFMQKHQIEGLCEKFQNNPRNTDSLNDKWHIEYQFEEYHPNTSYLEQTVTYQYLFL